MTTTPVPGTVTLRAVSTDLDEVTGSFTTFAGEAHHLALAYDSTPLPADGASSRTVTVRVLDEKENLRTHDDTTRVTLAVLGSGTGGGSETVSGGEKTFTVTAASTPGLLSLSATAEGLVEAEGALTVGFVPLDLGVSTDPVGPSEVFRGGTYNVSFDIRNHGSAPTAGAFNVEVYLVGGADSIKMGEEIIAEPLAPNSSLHVDYSFLLPSFSFVSLADSVRWVVRVDADSSLKETEESRSMRSGNSVAFPVISIPEDSLQIGQVLVGEPQGLSFMVFNSGFAPLSFEIVSLDSQVTAAPDSVDNLLPGEGRMITAIAVPRQPGPFVSALQILSNDPKGDFLVHVHGMVVFPDRVFLDFDTEPGNQGQTNIEAGASQEVPLELYVKDLPAVRGVSVTLQFDPINVAYIDSSWQSGSFFSDAFLINEEELLAPGLVEVSMGSWGGGGGTASGHLGSLKLKTTGAFLGNDDSTKTVLRAIRIRYLHMDGRLDSLQVLSEATIVSTPGDSWPDLDGNGIVEFSDFLIFARAFKHDASSPGWHVELPELPFPQTPYKRFDVDGDGQIGFFDFLSFADAFRNALEAGP